MAIYKVKEDTSFQMVTFIKLFSKMVNLVDRLCSSPKIIKQKANITKILFKEKSR